MKDICTGLRVAIFGLAFVAISWRIAISLLSKHPSALLRTRHLTNLTTTRSNQSHVLITGVTGFLGLHIAHKLSQLDYKVVGLDSLYDGSEETRFKFLRLDALLPNTTVLDASICNSTLLADLHARYSFQHVFLLADFASCSCLAPLLSFSEQTPHRSKLEFQVVIMNMDEKVLGPYQWPYVDTAGLDKDTGPDIFYNHMTGKEVYIEDVANNLQAFVHKLMLSSHPTSTSPHTLIFSPNVSNHLTSHVQAINATLQWYANYERDLMPCECPCQVHDVAAANGSPLCFSSAWGQASRLSVQASRGCRIVVYTVLLSERVDRIHPLPRRWPPGCAFAFITSTSPLYVSSLQPNANRRPFSNWTFIPVSPLQAAWKDMRRASRLPKLTPDYFFAPEVQYAVYVDGKLLLQPELTPEHFESFVRPGVGDVPVMVLVQHPHNAHLFDDLALLLHHPNRPHISHYPQLVERQAHHYRSMEVLSAGTSRPLCLNFTFDGALLVHNIGNRTWGSNSGGSSSSAESAADGGIISKGPGAKLRCTWLREYLSWADRDQLAGGLVLGKLNQQVLPRLPAECSNAPPILLVEEFSKACHSSQNELE
eukprot:gene27640-33378_t